MKRLAGTFALLALLATPAFCDDAVTRTTPAPEGSEVAQPEETPIAPDTAVRFRLLAGMELVAFSGSGGWAVGSGPTIGAMYAVADKWAVDLTVTEAFGLAYGFNTLFTRLGAGVTYALTGKITRRAQSLKLNEASVLHVSERPQSGWRVRLSGVQYLFTGATQIFPYAGFGASLGYEFPLNDRVNCTAGLNSELLSNTQAYVIPISAFASLQIGL